MKNRRVNSNLCWGGGGSAITKSAPKDEWAEICKKYEVENLWEKKKPKKASKAKESQETKK